MKKWTSCVCDVSADETPTDLLKVGIALYFKRPVQPQQQENLSPKQMDRNNNLNILAILLTNTSQKKDVKSLITLNTLYIKFC